MAGETPREAPAPEFASPHVRGIAEGALDTSETWAAFVERANELMTLEIRRRAAVPTGARRGS